MDIKKIDRTLGKEIEVGQIIYRYEMSKEGKKKRTIDRGEVYTPSWICNCQNNLIDREIFKGDVFNKEVEKSWEVIEEKIRFKDFTWEEYVLKNVMEVACGEGPYICSVYDTVSGEDLPVCTRIGLLDRKLRVISENIEDNVEWVKWCKRVVKCCYGFDYMMDNVYKTRCNIMRDVEDWYHWKFNKEMDREDIKDIEYIVSWNIFRMDGLTYTVPDEYDYIEDVQMDLFKDDVNYIKKPIYVKIMDWNENKQIYFKDLIKY